MKEITINIKTSKSANKFDENSLIHNLALKDMEEIIDKRVQENVDIEDREHTTISILADRGYGKSSLLLSLKENIKSIKEDTLVLRVLDPTLIENRQNILITLIALIREQVNEQVRCQDDDKNQYNYPDWLKSIKMLAEGLRALDGVGKRTLDTDIWEDPTIILEKGLSQAISEESLEQNFYKFIEKSLELLNKKKLVVLFDDIDTNFTKGDEVLETIRKYLRYPNIITIIAANMDLLIKLVRRKSWTQFSNLIKYDDYTKEDIKQTIDQLEEQYLLKVLPSYNRVALKSMYELLQLDNKFIFQYENKKVELSKSSKKTNDFFVVLNKRYFKISDFFELDKKVFLKALTSLPIRTIVQFVQIYMSCNEKEFVHKVLPLFNSLLFHHNIKTSEILLNGHIAISQLAIILLTNKDKISISESYRLKPIFSDTDSNTFMLLLNISINDILKNSTYNIFSYFIKVGLTRELSLAWPYPDEDQSVLINFVGLNENELPIKMIRRTCGFIYGATGNRSFYNGYIKTYQQQEYLTKQKNIKNIQNNQKTSEKKSLPRYLSELIYTGKVEDNLLDTTLNNLNKDRFTPEYTQLTNILLEDNSLRKSLILNTHLTISEKLPDLKDKFLFNILFMQISSPTAATFSYASIFPLIGLISEVLMLNDEASLNNNLAILSQVRTFVAFSAKNNKHINDATDISEEDTLDNDNYNVEDTMNSIPDLSSEIMNWQNKFNRNTNILPVHILSKIWTRFYYSLENIASHKNNKHLGKMISLQITQFLNAWIIETLLYSENKISINLTNVLTDTKNFVSNYNRLEELLEDEKNKNQYLHLCQSVIDFPLWKYYLDDSVQKEIGMKVKDEKQITYKIKKNTYKFTSLVPLLNTVIVVRS